MYGYILNNSLFIKTDKPEEERIKVFKEVFSRILFSTAEFYKCTGENDFITYANIDDQGNQLSIYMRDSACFIGAYNKQSKTLSTSIDASILLDVKNSLYVNDFIIKLCRSENYYQKNGHLPNIMNNNAMKHRWEVIIAQMEKDGRAMPTKVANILLEDGTNLSKMFWDFASSKSQEFLNLTIVKTVEKDIDER